MRLSKDIQSILKALRSVLPETQDIIGLHEPLFRNNEWLYVKECLDTGWVSSAGNFVDRFEDNLTEFTGVKKAVAVVNGTAALHMCLVLSGVVTGDEVLVPSLTFVATANAVSYCGAIPHFIDSEIKTLGVDPSRLEAYLHEITGQRGDGCFNKYTGRRIKAVIAVHTFGHPVDLDPLLEVCSRYNLELIEDAAESLGSFYKGRHTGNWGLLSALSFNGNKIITTGGGGAVITNDNELGNIAKHLTTTARVRHRWSYYHDRVGYNYRLPNINAALGCAQLEQLPLFLSSKRALAWKYREAFRHVEGITFFTEPEFARSNYWLNVLLLDDGDIETLDALLEVTNDSGIVTRPAWTLMHRLPMYSGCPHMELQVAESIEKRIINIPSSASLAEGIGEI